jgi:Protein of unknown function (DUF2934)
MAKEKKPSEKSAPGKTAARKSPAKKAAAPKAVPGKAVAVAQGADAASVAAPARTALPLPQPPAAELYEEIRRRAYEFYCERGGHHGSHEADWHRAELEVRSKYR